MIDILFVDDEPDVLEGLENRLRPWRKQWNLQFASSADEALQLLEQRTFDVVVSDMRMPGTDGAELLRQVRDRWPEAVRIILSGQADRDGVLRALPIAHQFLSKPCDAARLQAVVSRCHSLHEQLFADAVKRTIASVAALPALPRLYWELADELDRASATVRRVAAIIEQDVAMTARLLQIVNSAFFACARPICSVREAVTLLGLEPVRALVLSSALFRSAAAARSAMTLDLERMHAHALSVAAIAQTLPDDPELRSTAMAAGMLHDIGQMILPLPIASLDSGQRIEAELRLHGCSHAEVGAHLLGLWGLPQPLVEAVAFHHRPSLLDEQQLSAAGAVHVADCLQHRREPGGAPAEALDSGYLARVGLLDRLPQWQQRWDGAGQSP